MSIDTGLVSKNINENYGGDVQTYAADLNARIKVIPSLTDDWLSCTPIVEPRSVGKTAHGVKEDVKRLLTRSEDATEASITPLDRSCSHTPRVKTCARATTTPMRSP
ncbi:hypothetical protein FKP32DRAFT_1590365, partial [Trametes sanguinea]